MDMLRYVDDHEADLSSLRLLLCGGSAVPLALMQAFAERHGVEFLQAWGMTETSPVATAARAPAGVGEEDAWRYRASAGRPFPLIEARIRREEGEGDGETGELQVRGPWIASAYYRDDASDERFEDGWLRTGDIASIDELGFITISDRTKDVIKSGGEWISSVELENEIMAHPSVVEAAVIATPDTRWGERPLACVVCEDGAYLGLDELHAHLAPRVAKWWLPDAIVIIDEVPKTSVGKFDKKVLRGRLKRAKI
jgi:fatty-acyl-CoA synthase